MKSRPILFSGAMVRAILDGTKTQTRRIVKPQPKNQVIEGIAGITIGMDHSKDGAVWYDADCVNPGRKMECPFGEIGDRLWCRETFCNAALASYPPVYLYRADGDTKPKEVNWKPSIFMPRAACRIELEITGIRVERLNRISEADALAEGIQISYFHARKTAPTEDHFLTPAMAYMDLWESINGPGSWAANPFVWVIEFTRVEVSK